MMIGVLSDTHIPRAAEKLPKEVLAAFENVDLIIHAGDMVEMSVLDELRKLAKTKAVSGNMDDPELARALPNRLVVAAGKFKIGIIHGMGSPSVLVNSVTHEFDKTVNVIIFGHSHVPMNEKKEGVLLFNPGSPTDKIYAPYNSFGILDVTENDIEGRIIRI